MNRSTGERIKVNYEILSEKYPYINWKLYLEMKIKFYEIEKSFDFLGFILNDPNILENLGNIIQKTDIETLTIYMEW